MMQNAKSLHLKQQQQCQQNNTPISPPLSPKPSFSLPFMDSAMVELFLPLFFVLLLSSVSVSVSVSYPQRHLLQSPSQNIETSFPSVATPAFANPIPPPPTTSTVKYPSTSRDGVDKRLTKAVVTTGVLTFVLSAVLFAIVHWFVIKKYRKRTDVDMHRAYRRYNNPMKVKDSMVADEVYWRGLGSSLSPRRCNHCYNILHAAPEEEEASPYRNENVVVEEDRKIQKRQLIPSGSLNSSTEIAKDLNPVVPPPAAAAPPPPPPPPPKVAPTPPPPPPPRNVPPPPPPIAKKNPAPAPPMPPMPPRPNAPRSTGMSTPLLGGGPSRPLPAVPGKGEGAKAKLRPLHWDKVTAVNPEHSMVWDKIDANGSFRFDDDLMESLFGYAAANRQTNKRSTNPFLGPSAASQQVCLLDPRKSQNSAIVIRSLAVGRQEILDALLEGRGLGHDALEKLSKIAPTKDEESRIAGFAGDPSTLADAESFLHHLLRAVPSPFARLHAMLFRSSYDAEVLHLKQSLRTLELACQELRSRGLFLKLLEAILKAGNRMNAGTARGDAKAFNLTALCKLSDVKSTDGKTTLLHFVVEEVVRLEGKRAAVLNRSASLRRLGSTSSSSGGGGNLNSGALRASREKKEKEYTMLGLPVVGGLSSELANVKKAATMDFEALVSSCLSIGERIRESQQFLKGCGAAADGFAKEMKGFLEAAAEEIGVVGEEQLRIVDLVRRTTEYYQPGSSRDKGQQQLQLFVIVRDFLVMFDRVCVDIMRSTQKKQPAATTTTTTPNKASSPKKEGEERQRRVVATFPNLPPRFMTEDLRSSSSSDSEEEF